MGTRVAILAVGDGDFAESLRRLPRADAGRTEALLGQAYPGYQVALAEGWPLDESLCPDEDDVVYALSAPGIGVMCDRRFLTGTPSQLPAHLVEMAGSRRMALCAMHSVDDSFAYAVWANGVLVRSLSVSLSAERVVIEDIGEPAEFELPFWADRRRGLLGSHPLDLGQQALRFLFGFAAEEPPEPGDLDASQIGMLGYRVTDPTGAEQAAREAAVREFMRQSRRQSFALRPDGSWSEIGPERGTPTGGQ